MKFLLHVLSLWLIASFQNYSGTDSFTIEVENINKLKGTIYVAIFDNDDHFPEDGHGIRYEKKEVSASQETIILKDMSLMDCAIAIYHDVNENGELDKNWLGIPKEPYGFSNNFIPKFRAPSFEECLLKANDWKSTVTIRLTN